MVAETRVEHTEHAAAERRLAQPACLEAILYSLNQMRHGWALEPSLFPGKATLYFFGYLCLPFSSKLTIDIRHG